MSTISIKCCLVEIDASSVTLNAVSGLVLCCPVLPIAPWQASDG